MAPDDYVVWSYLVYLTLTLCTTVMVARTLHKNGRVFLLDAFGGQGALADSVNHLLVVGFYLINVGYVAVALKSTVRPVDMRTSIEFISTKVGWVLLVLGAMHFFNVYVFARFRRRGMVRHAPPPVRPGERIPTA